MEDNPIFWADGSDPQMIEAYKKHRKLLNISGVSNPGNTEELSLG
jgi:hypothetical protein